MTAGPLATPPLHARYQALDPGSPLDDDVLTAVVFGARTPCPADPRCLRIDLEPLAGTAHVEVWRGGGEVRLGTSGPIRHVEDGEHFAGWLRLDEQRFGGLLEATEAAYRAMLGLHADSPYRHVCRIWNFISDITAGEGDAERYRQFCLGRARAFAASHGGPPGIGYPAASAVGKQGPASSLEVCWFAMREPGVAIENPRQTSAFHYPRRYGPAAPAFSRAVIAPDNTLFVSGTASIVGHASVHPNDAAAQLDETMANLEALLQRALASKRLKADRLGASSLLKVFVRRATDAPMIEQKLRQHLGDQVQLLILAADICRSELLLEIEFAHRD